MRSSLKEALERPVRDRSAGAGRRPSGIPVELVLRAPGVIEQPVSLVRALAGFGLDLGEAHDVLDRLAGGHKVPVTLYLTPQSESPFALQGFGICADAPTRDEAIDLIRRRGLAAA